MAPLSADTALLEAAEGAALADPGRGRAPARALAAPGSGLVGPSSDPLGAHEAGSDPAGHVEGPGRGVGHHPAPEAVDRIIGQSHGVGVRFPNRG